MNGNTGIIKLFTKGKLVRLYSVTVFYKLVVVVLGFANSILINRCLGVALRGEYTTIINWASLMQLFLNLGIGSAYPAVKRRYADQSKAIFSTLTIIIAIAYALIFLFLGGLASAEAKYIFVIAYISTIQNLIIFISIVEDVKKRNGINIITGIIHTLVLIGVFIFFKTNLYAVLYAVILDHIILGLVLVIKNRIWDFKPRLLNKSIVVEILKIAIPAMLMNMLMYLNYHADVLFLSELTKDNSVVGLYGTAVSLANMLWIIPDAFKDILYNRAAKEDNPKEVMLAIVVNIFMCICIIIGFALIGKWFLGFMYGSDFVAAYSLTLMMFVGTLPMVLYKLIHPIYIANGKTTVVVTLLAVAVGANVIGNLVLIPLYQGEGAALSSIASYMICGVIFYIKFKHDYKTCIVSTLKALLIGRNKNVENKG